MKAADLNLRPGDLGFTKIGGFTGKWIAAALAINDDGSPYEHVFMVVSDTHVLEGMPQGSRLAPIDRKYDGPVEYKRLPLSDEVRANIVRLAPQFVGLKYSFMTYGYLGLLNLGIPAPHLRKYIRQAGRRHCAQVVDELLNRAGYQMFDDGREWLDVTPGDLWNAANARIIGSLPKETQTGPEFKK